MHGTIPPEKPTEPQVKHRTITLTNRAPIRIVEDDWPILAQGQHYGPTHFYQGEEYGHMVQIFLRRHKNWNDPKRRYDVSEILHAKYEWSEPCQSSEGWDIYSQTVRVGRILAEKTYVMDGRMKCESVDDLWRHIREIGDEIRERLHKPEHKKTVTLAVDALFANLAPHD